MEFNYSEIVQRAVNNTWFRGNMLQVVFPSIGCQKSPRCSMCNFGTDTRNCTAAEAVKIVDNALDFFAHVYPEYSAEKYIPSPMDILPGITLLLGTYGSILDAKECGYLKEVFRSLATQQRILHISTIILETHYTTVDINYLNELRDILETQKYRYDNTPPQIIIEMGLESSTPAMQVSIRKHIDLGDLTLKLHELHRNNYRTILNVLLGIPGVTPYEQVTDCAASVVWACTHGADEVAIFPINVWEGSELYLDYVTGKYQRPTAYQLLAVLAKLNPSILGRVSISWYGDRQLKNPGWDPTGSVLPPDSGISGSKFLVDLVDAFHEIRDSSKRFTFIQGLWESAQDGFKDEGHDSAPDLSMIPSGDYGKAVPTMPGGYLDRLHTVFEPIAMPPRNYLIKEFGKEGSEK